VLRPKIDELFRILSHKLKLVEFVFVVRNPLPLEGHKLTSVVFWVVSYSASETVGRFLTLRIEFCRETAQSSISLLV